LASSIEAADARAGATVNIRAAQAAAKDIFELNMSIADIGF
jgi:hypothetical protein